MADEDASPRGARGDPKEPREFVKYTFYKVRPEWRLLHAGAQKKKKGEVVAPLHRLEVENVLRR